jgi:tetratricopeptide (TPR) repeat protein
MNSAYISAAERYRAALQIVPQHPAALLGLAEVLLSSAGQHVAMGATGAAAVELAEAAELATAAASGVKTAAVGAASAAEGGVGAAVSPRASAAAAAVALLTPSPGPARGSVTSSSTTAAASDTTQQQLPEQFQYSSNIVTAWKLLGDILLQQHLLQPAATAVAREALADAESAVAAALASLASRQGLLAKARRAYAHALRLNPAAGEVWGDVAQCYGHQARLLLELQPHQQIASSATAAAAAPAATAVSKAEADPVAAARAAAVRTARGGLRLAPASSWLWGVLAGAAAAAGDPAAAEYGYSRALALDPKAAMLWVQLGRLYSRYGSGTRANVLCVVAFMCMCMRLQSDPMTRQFQVNSKGSYLESDKIHGGTGFDLLPCCVAAVMFGHVLLSSLFLQLSLLSSVMRQLGVWSLLLCPCGRPWQLQQLQGVRQAQQLLRRQQSMLWGWEEGLSHGWSILLVRFNLSAADTACGSRTQGFIVVKAAGLPVVGWAEAVLQPPHNRLPSSNTLTMSAERFLVRPPVHAATDLTVRCCLPAVQLASNSKHLRRRVCC